MAKLVGGPLGSYRGKAGGTIGTSWKGIAVVKAMPLSVANPNSTLQQSQRGAFSQCVSVARLLLSDLIKPYWDPFSKRMSGYNSFIKQNIKAFDKNGLVKPGDFYSSRGILKGVDGLGITSLAGDESFQVTWLDNSGQGDAQELDIAVYVWFNATQKTWHFFNGINGRADTAETVSDPSIEEGDVIDFWIFFTRSDKSKVSDSSYKQFVVTA